MNARSLCLAIKNASSPEKALHLYTLLQRWAYNFDSFSVVYTLKACTKLKNPTLIRHLHTHLFKWGFSSDVYVATALLNAYVSSSFSDACHLFDEMPVRNTVTWNTMITGYSRVGDVEKARDVFETMQVRNLASWSAMIAGYMSCGRWSRGLMLFRKMVAKGRLMPDQYMLCSSIMACGHMGSIGLLLGKSLNGFAVKNGWILSVELGTVLFEMAERVVDRILRSVHPDNHGGVYTLICDLYDLNGKWNEAERVRKLMVDHNVKKPRGSSFRGDKVEVASKEDGYLGSYFEATVVAELAQTDYIVQYKNLVKNDFSGPLLETVPREELRPVPYSIPQKGFRVGDMVDAYANEGWWVGMICGKTQDKYVVFFEFYPEFKYVYPASKLRIHQDWVNGSWESSNQNNAV
ncbi:hypothetical protein ACET3Z_004131 [Daucus carota]